MKRAEEKFAAGNFSDVDQAGDPSPYITYLDQASVFLKSIRQFGNELLRLRPGDRVLDLGCGTGDALRELLSLVGSGGCAVGVDSSEAMVVEACRRPTGSKRNLFFARGDARQLPFADNCFDACSAERLFVHLVEPLNVLRDLVRVLRPGGRAVVRETDLELVALDCSDHVTSRNTWDYFISSVRNGYIGRELFGLFLEAGLADVRVHVIPIVLNHFQDLNTLLPFETTAKGAAAEGRISPERVRAMLADLHERDAKGQFFACVFAFVVFGQKTR